MNSATRLASFLLALLSSTSLAQTFVLDPYFGDGGVATYEWPAINGYQWNAVDAWAVRMTDGKWAMATQLRDGTSQIVLKRDSEDAARKKASELKEMGWFDVEIRPDKAPGEKPAAA